MARPTKLAAELAGAVGVSPSQVQGWMERGLGPVGAETNTIEHFRHLTPLLGAGRQDDVAALKMAADGYPCRCLRDVLAGLAHQGAEQATDADDLVEHLMGDEAVADLRDLMTEQARQLPPPVEWTAPQDGQPEAETDEPERAALTVRTASLPIADLVAGDPVEPYDTADLDRMGGWEQLGMPAQPLDDDGAALNLATLALALETARTGDDWIAEAEPQELARGVGAAQVLMDAWAVLHPGIGSWGDEHRWRRIGWMAPTAVQLLGFTLAAFDMAAGVEVSPTLGRYMDAVERGRRLLPRSALESPPTTE